MLNRPAPPPSPDAAPHVFTGPAQRWFKISFAGALTIFVAVFIIVRVLVWPVLILCL